MDTKTSRINEGRSCRSRFSKPSWSVLSSGEGVTGAIESDEAGCSIGAVGGCIIRWGDKVRGHDIFCALRRCNGKYRGWNTLRIVQVHCRDPIGNSGLGNSRELWVL